MAAAAAAVADMSQESKWEGLKGQGYLQGESLETHFSVDNTKNRVAVSALSAAAAAAAVGQVQPGGHWVKGNWSRVHQRNL